VTGPQVDGPGELGDAPDTAALDAWYEKHHNQRDRPTTLLWFPGEAPYAVLQTFSRGPECTQVLADPDKPMVDVHLGGHIQIGGYLSDMEAYFAAVVDAIRIARWQADRIVREMAAEADRTES
jgi:hypothetical protein